MAAGAKPHNIVISLLLILATQAAATALHVSITDFSLSLSGLAQFIITASEIQDGQWKPSDVISLLRTDTHAVAERSSTRHQDCRDPTPDTRCEECPAPSDCEKKAYREVQQAAEVLRPLRDALKSLVEAAAADYAGKPALNPEETQEAIKKLSPIREALESLMDADTGDAALSDQAARGIRSTLQPIREALLWLAAYG
eukprot:gnl/TRDRNA2_/TRDRNA2_174585_c4_seq11.p1 gnl/TRDRNA2_/TRDRNA2_174585_c4~~gnl/TRDRNA2_/TRDRNA2_174585_c4_seq11.p1  ORF type:complete len:199 (+),score=30.36 gnl/TRDRNA2_/TRDRNA2_174585_c4_seq11:145-741(+)